jgi:hypothetical protein
MATRAWEAGGDSFDPDDGPPVFSFGGKPPSRSTGGGDGVNEGLRFRSSRGGGWEGTRGADSDDKFLNDVDPDDDGLGDGDGCFQRKRGRTGENGEQRFENLDAHAEPVRNPLDAAPYPEAIDDDEGECFPSIFAAINDKDSSLAAEELRHSWTRLQILIDRSLESKSTPADVVNMVYEYYEANIRSEFESAPTWSKKSIYKYIYSDHLRQATENIAAVYNTIEFLRTQTAVKAKDGQVRTNPENIKLLLASTKVHATLLDLKRKRDRG